MSPAIVQGIRSVGTEGLLGLIGGEKGFELDKLLVVFLALFLEPLNGLESVFEVELNGFALEQGSPEPGHKEEGFVGVEHGVSPISQRP
jgi:hypothetical protein